MTVTRRLSSFKAPYPSSKRTSDISPGSKDVSRATFADQSLLPLTTNSNPIHDDPKTLTTVRATTRGTHASSRTAPSSQQRVVVCSLSVISHLSNVWLIHTLLLTFLALFLAHRRRIQCRVLLFQRRVQRLRAGSTYCQTSMIKTTPARSNTLA